MGNSKVLRLGFFLSPGVIADFQRLKGGQCRRSNTEPVRLGPEAPGEGWLARRALAA